MARKRKLSDYPVEYATFFLLASKKEMVLALDTEANARSTRNDLYAFRSVLYDEAPDSIAAMRAQNVRLFLHGRNIIAEPIRDLEVHRREHEHK